MITAIEYALMAGHAYRTTRDETNWIPVPLGWTPFFPVPDPTTATSWKQVTIHTGSSIAKTGLRKLKKWKKLDAD